MPSPSAHRQSLLRERRKRGLKCIQVELRSSEIAELIRRGHLSESSQDDMTAVRGALYQHLDKTLTGAT